MENRRGIHDRTKLSGRSRRSSRCSVSISSRENAEGTGNWRGTRRPDRCQISLVEPSSSTATSSVTFYGCYVTPRACRPDGIIWRRESRRVCPTRRSCELVADQSGIRSLSVTDGSRARPTGYADRGYSQTRRAYRLSTRARRSHGHARLPLPVSSFTRVFVGSLEFRLGSVTVASRGKVI